MINFFRYYVNSIFSNFKFYRTSKGGVWYKVRDDDDGGIAGGIEYWTQERPDNENDILNIENYN